MFIIPIDTKINSIIKPESLVKPLDKDIKSIGNSSDKNVKGEFKDFFLDVIKNVEETEKVTKEDAYNLSIGNMDDMHTMLINAAKAEVALQTMVQLRNKVLESYSEVMRINL